MTKTLFFCICVMALLCFCSCRNKTVQLLTKKWECVQVDNIVPPNTRLISAEDSANTAALQSLLRSISWTFKNNMRYECTVGSNVTVQGRYQLMENDKILVCTPASKNNINTYSIQELTADALTLRSLNGNSNLVLHFKPQ